VRVVFALSALALFFGGPFVGCALEAEEHLSDEAEAASNPIVARGSFAAPGQTFDKLAAMKGWVIAWDEGSEAQTGGKRWPKLRVFRDGRVLCIGGVGSPLVQTTIGVDEVILLIKQFKEQATPRDFDKLLPIKSNVPLSGEDYKKLQKAVYDTAYENNLADPLPSGLWNQTAERVAVRDGAKLYDMVSISPILDDRGRWSRVREVAPIPDEITARLRELENLAAIGGQKELDKYVVRANDELRRKFPKTPIRLTSKDLGYASRDNDGSLSVTFQFSKDPKQLSYPSGEINYRTAPGKSPYVERATYEIDKETSKEWGEERLKKRAVPRK
jgi:hypothetical protein